KEKVFRIHTGKAKTSSSAGQIFRVSHSLRTLRFESWNPKNMKRVVVTGIGVLAPGARGAEEFESLLREGRSAVQHRPEMAALGMACQVAGVPDPLEEVQDYYFDTALQMRMDRHTVLGCVAGIDCWRDAGLPEPASERVDWDTAICFG